MSSIFPLCEFHTPFQRCKSSTRKSQTFHVMRCRCRAAASLKLWLVRRDVHVHAELVFYGAIRMLEICVYFSFAVITNLVTTNYFSFSSFIYRMHASTMQFPRITRFSISFTYLYAVLFLLYAVNDFSYVADANTRHLTTAYHGWRSVWNTNSQRPHIYAKVYLFIVRTDLFPVYSGRGGFIESWIIDRKRDWLLKFFSFRIVVIQKRMSYKI